MKVWLSAFTAAILMLAAGPVLAQAARAPNAATPAAPGAPPAAAAPAAPATEPELPDLTTTRGLTSACNSAGPNGRTFCLGVMYGAVTMYSSITAATINGQLLLQPAGRIICPPAGLDFEAVRDNFVTWVNGDPLRAELPLQRVLLIYLYESYPCAQMPAIPNAAAAPAPAAPAAAPTAPATPGLQLNLPRATPK